MHLKKKCRLNFSTKLHKNMTGWIFCSTNKWLHLIFSSWCSLPVFVPCKWVNRCHLAHYCWAAVPSKQYICSLTSILNIAYKITFRQRRSHSVPRGIHSPHTRSAPVVSDIDAPPSAAPFLTPLSLPSPSLKPGTESEPGSITQQESVLHACLHADL